MTIGLSHGGTTIYSSPSPSNEVLVGTREGVVTIARENSDAEWQVTHRAIHRQTHQRDHQRTRERPDVRRRISWLSPRQRRRG